MKTTRKTKITKTTNNKTLAKRSSIRFDTFQAKVLRCEKVASELSWTEARKIMDDLIRRNAKVLKKLASLE
jgi:hypothetical protein